MTKETCQVEGCGKEIPASMIFCDKHSWLLPVGMNGRLLKLKRDYETMRQQAVGIIKMREGK